MKKNTEWTLRITKDGGYISATRGTGPVELMQTVCNVVGVVWKIPNPGDYVFMGDNTWCKRVSPGRVMLPVIPAEPEPCSNCHNVKGKKRPPWFWDQWAEIRNCAQCGRPESEWTYADPEWAGIGSGIM